MTSAGVVPIMLSACGRLSAWATTSRSRSIAKILPIPTRKIASESARMIWIDLAFASPPLEWGAQWSLSVATMAWFGETVVLEMGSLYSFEVIFIDHYRNVTSGAFSGATYDAALA